jgi:hypothetical protein
MRSSRIYSAYCSDKSARAAGSRNFSGRSSAISESLIGSAKKGEDMGRGMKLIIPIIGIIIVIIGLVGLVVDGIRNAVSDIKIKIVLASCETQEEFASILKEALSGVSTTVIEGEEFTTYSQQARDAVKEGNFGILHEEKTKWLSV